MLPWADLAALQGRYAGATSEAEQRAIGVEFERAVRARQAEHERDERLAELEELLAQPPTLVDDELVQNGMQSGA